METAMENEENFAEMFEQNYKEPSRMEPGQKVEAAIVNLTPEWALIEVGGKGEGYIDINELKDADGTVQVKVGDKVRAYFLHTEEGEMRFTTKIGTGPAARAQILDAFKSHIPMEGKVSKELKGGFEIIISGGMRAFCPYSQMGIRRDENKEAYIGASMIFFIIECDRRDIVLSRKEIVEKERQEKIAVLKETLQEGHKVRGVVTSIQNFGAFVDIGGVEGLLPVSELAWGRTGTVSRLAPFGAFVTLGPGVDGLIHVSRLGGEKRINHPEDVLKNGQSIEVRVEAVDLANKRISLVPAEISREEDETAATMQKYQQKETTASDEPAMGSMGEQLKRQMEKRNKIDK